MKTQYVTHSLTVIGIALLCFLATACGKAPISSTAASLGACKNLVSTGTWYDSTPIQRNDTMVLDNTCAGTRTYCNEKFTYQIQADNITVFIFTTQTLGGPSCFALGLTICHISVDPNNPIGGGQTNKLMQVTNCTTGPVNYQYQNP